MISVPRPGADASPVPRRVGGSLIGGLIAQFLGAGDIRELDVLGFVLAVVTAVLLIGVAESIAGRGRAVRR